jgi:hypothetical protein
MVMGVSVGEVIPNASFPIKAQGALRGFGDRTYLAFDIAIGFNFLLT